MLTLSQQTITTYPTEAGALALQAQLLADDPDTDYRVVANLKGYFVAIFEDGAKIYTL